MRTRAAVSALLTAPAIALLMNATFAGNFARPATSSDRAIVLAGGMSGGGAMGGDGGGMGGGAGGMSGGHFGGSMFGGPMTGFPQPAQQTSDTDATTANYTYQCITSAGACAFVAPAWMRASKLKSGAGCLCNGQTAGHVE